MTPLSTLLRAYLPDGWSGREVAREADRLEIKLSAATANNYLNGKIPAEPKVATLEAFAAVFRIDVGMLLDAAALPTARERYRGPSESKLLDQRERQALDEIINVLLAAKRKGGGEASGPRLTSVPPGAPSDSDSVVEEGARAARKPPPGGSRGRQLRRDQDDAATGSQDPGGPGGDA